MLSRVCSRISLIRPCILAGHPCNIYVNGYLGISHRFASFNAMDQTVHDLLINKYPEWQKSVRQSNDGNLLFEKVNLNNININVYTFYDKKLDAHMIGVTNNSTNKDATYKIMDSKSPAWDANYIGEMPQIVERLANQTTK